MTTMGAGKGRTALRRAGLVGAALGAAGSLLVAGASPASAGEFQSFSSKYINGKCQAGVIDFDCYSYIGVFTTHQGCFNKVAAFVGVDPKTDIGKFWVGQANWYCPTFPPNGYRKLWVYDPTHVH